MDLGIRGKVAAVAAASQGLGYATALELAREGARVSICSRSKDRIEAAAERIRREVTDAVVEPMVVDVTKEDECVDFVTATAKKLGRIDILLTNTGGPVPGAMDDVNFSDFRDGVDSTLMNAIVMMKTAAGYMREQRWGRIINVLSMTVKQPKVNLLVSNTMRPAILGFAKSISFELAPYNVTVNNVAPGYTRTERLEELADHVAASGSGAEKSDVYAEWERTVPARRLGEPEEFAALVAFLASERAAYITGTTIQVDGGSTLGLF